MIFNDIFDYNNIIFEIKYDTYYWANPWMG